MTTNRISENGARDQWHGSMGGTSHLGQMLRMIRLAQNERKTKEGRCAERTEMCRARMVVYQAAERERERD